jgi:hypothetical protein
MEAWMIISYGFPRSDNRKGLSLVAHIMRFARDNRKGLSLRGGMFI